MSRLRRVYGITEAAYEALFKNQQGRCSVCGGHPKTRRLAVDHCHATGFVRGLCCSICNQALQAFRDDPSLLRRAAEHLEAASAQFGLLSYDDQDEWLTYRGRISGKERRARIAKAQKSRPLPRLPQTEYNDGVE